MPPARRPQAFLQRMMALCVASHYRNTPNDLILMSDAPAHHLFVLLGPVDETQASPPSRLRVLCSMEQGSEIEVLNQKCAASVRTFAECSGLWQI